MRAPHNAFVFPDVGTPTLVEPGADLMLLHPNGSEELLVQGGKKNSVADPFVSFAGKSVDYAFFYASHGADIYKGKKTGSGVIIFAKVIADQETTEKQ